MKKQIRKEIIKKRMSLSPSEISEKSKLIFKNLLSLGLFKKNMKVLVFMDFKNEVSTKLINNYILDNNMTLLLPKADLTTRELVIQDVKSLNTLVLSDYGILEPTDSHPVVDYSEIDLIIAPGVAFDEERYRLGYGGGFYDKLLSKKRKDTMVVAIAFDIQFVNSVPRESHDKKIQCIVTETRILK